MIIGLDVSPRITGWCAGAGAQTPTAGAFELPDVETRGPICDALWQKLYWLRDEFQPTHLIYERPLLVSTGKRRDNLPWLRKRYGVDAVVELFCERYGIQYEDVDLFRLKRELGGFSGAEKDDMIWAAEKLGVRLPSTKVAGKADAADAVACWLYGIRKHARQHAQAWDRKLWSARGALNL